MAAAKKEPDPLAQLRGVLHVLENRRREPMSEVLQTVGTMVRDALAVLQEPDPLRRRIEFVLLAIQQSTEVRQFTRNGKVLTRVRVVELDLYNWALAQVHDMAGAA